MKDWLHFSPDFVFNLKYHILHGWADTTTEKYSVLQHFNSFRVLMVGRVLGGIATSILYSAFESWLLCEHNKVGHYSHILFIVEIHFFW